MDRYIETIVYGQQHEDGHHYHASANCAHDPEDCHVQWVVVLRLDDVEQHRVVTRSRQRAEGVLRGWCDERTAPTTPMSEAHEA